MNTPLLGYPIHIFTGKIVDKFLCTWCGNVLNAPLQNSCGHRFCTLCLEDNWKSSPKCPEDMTPIRKEDCFPDNFARREIRQLPVLCEGKGCQWRGKLGDLEDHFRECLYALVLCENYPKCKEKLPPKKLKDHLAQDCPMRLVECCLCSNSVPFAEFDMHQAKEHTKSIKHSSLSKVCPDGCDELVREDQLPRHLDMSMDLKKLALRLSKLEKKLANTLLTTNTDDVVKDCAPGISSASTDKDLEDKNNLKSSKRVEKDAVVVSRSALEEMKQKQDTLTTLCTQQAEIKSLLQILEMRTNILESTSYDGRFVWKIGDFRSRVEQAANGKNLSLYSPPFFTDRYGYKLCLRLYPNGDGLGKGKCISLFFIVMQGEFDGLLPWPFRSRITFKLLHPKGKHITDSFLPDPQSSSFQKPTRAMNIASGCPLFATRDQLWRDGFVIDDSIFVSAEINA